MVSNEWGGYPNGTKNEKFQQEQQSTREVDLLEKCTVMKGFSNKYLT